MSGLARLTATACAGFFATSSAMGAPAIINGRYSRAEITNQRIGVGRERITLRVILKPGWHSYWVNPGDGGIPPRLSWDHTPAAQTLSFSTPSRFISAGAVTFGYNGGFSIVADTSWAKTLHLAHATFAWAVCDGHRCTLEQGEFKVDTDTAGEAAPADPAAPTGVSGTDWSLHGSTASLRLPAQDSRTVRSAIFFPAAAGAVWTDARQTFSISPGEWRVAIALVRPVTSAPKGVLAVTFADGTRRGYVLDTDLGGSDAVRR